jgi:hypothetical protein
MNKQAIDNYLSDVHIFVQSQYDEDAVKAMLRRVGYINTTGADWTYSAHFPYVYINCRNKALHCSYGKNRQVSRQQFINDMEVFMADTTTSMKQLYAEIVAKQQVLKDYAVQEAKNLGFVKGAVFVRKDITSRPPHERTIADIRIVDTTAENWKSYIVSDFIGVIEQEQQKTGLPVICALSNTSFLYPLSMIKLVIKPKKPSVNGYEMSEYKKGDTCVKFGCAVLQLDILADIMTAQAKGNKNVRQITGVVLDSGVTITCSQIKEIQEYVNHINSQS